MRSFTRKERPATTTAAGTDQDAAEDHEPEQDRVAEPETAQSRKAEADQEATEADRSRTAAERLVADAEAEAARIISEARQRAQALNVDAQNADRRAEVARSRSSDLAFRDGLRVSVRSAEDLAGTLRAEADKLTARVGDLDARLAETAARQEDVTAGLATAREAGDIAGVRDGRAELAAVDEVAVVLTGQRDKAAGRLADIGPADGTGELSVALSAALSARTELSDVLDRLDPSRVETRRNALMASFMASNGGDATAAALLTVAAMDPELVSNIYGSPSPGQESGRDTVLVRDLVDHHIERS